MIYFFAVFICSQILSEERKDEFERLGDERREVVHIKMARFRDDVHLLIIVRYRLEDLHRRGL